MKNDEAKIDDCFKKTYLCLTEDDTFITPI